MAGELASRIHAERHSVSIVTNDEILPRYGTPDGITVHTIGTLYPLSSLARNIQSMRRRTLFSNAVLLLITYYHDLRFIVLLRLLASRVGRILQSEHIDLIHSHMSLADILVARLSELGIPTLTTLHGEHFLRGETAAHFLLAPLIRLRSHLLRSSLASMEGVVAVSRAELHATEKWDRISHEKMRVIHNGVNLTRIREYGESPNEVHREEFRLLFPGGAKWVKGGDVLVLAVSKLRLSIPHVHLYVALDVPSDSQMRRLVREEGLEDIVTFTGFLDEKSYIGLLKSSDVFVLPSRREGFPLSILEAMACGKPIVTTDAGGISEVVKHGINGMVTHLDPDSLAHAISQLYEDAPLRQFISENNLRNVRDFDWTLVAREYIATYEEILRRVAVHHSTKEQRITHNPP